MEDDATDSRGGYKTLLGIKFEEKKFIVFEINSLLLNSNLKYNLIIKIEIKIKTKKFKISRAVLLLCSVKY